MAPCPTILSAIMEVMDTAFDPAFGEAWNRRQVSDALALPSTHAIVLDTSGRILAANSQPQQDIQASGFVLTRCAADEEELLLIAVSPEHRRKGIAQLLIDHLFEEAKARGVAQIFLEMRRGNPAIHLYRKVGFEPIGERRDYYRLANGKREDAITFARSI